MPKTNLLGKYEVFHSTANFVVLCTENMVSEKSKIISWVKVSRLEFVSLLIADQLQPIFFNCHVCNRGLQN